MHVFTRTNSPMDAALEEAAAFMASKRLAFRVDGRALAELVGARIAPHKGCYLLRWSSDRYALDPEGEFVPDQFNPDRTGYECFENHLHMEDFKAPPKDRCGIQDLALGITVAQILQLKLSQQHPQVPFHIVVGYANRPIDPNDREEFLYTCTVRFHAVRAGEVIYDDLESFEHEAMGVIEI